MHFRSYNGAVLIKNIVAVVSSSGRPSAGRRALAMRTPLMILDFRSLISVLLIEFFNPDDKLLIIISNSLMVY